MRNRRLNFFLQAEGGIRDLTVTGVQTCALPICRNLESVERRRFPILWDDPEEWENDDAQHSQDFDGVDHKQSADCGEHECPGYAVPPPETRSEERRVGQASGDRRRRYHEPISGE